jgi:hypothetical protein
MAMAADDIHTHPAFAAGVRSQARALLLAHQASQRAASPFAIQQRRLMAQAALATYLRNEAARRTGAGMAGMLDGLDGGARSTLRAHPAMHGAIQPLVADGVQASRAVRKPNGTFSLFTWIDDGGIVLDRLVAGRQRQIPYRSAVDADRRAQIPAVGRDRARAGTGRRSPGDAAAVDADGGQRAQRHLKRCFGLPMTEFDGWRCGRHLAYSARHGLVMTWAIVRRSDTYESPSTLHRHAGRPAEFPMFEPAPSHPIEEEMREPLMGTTEFTQKKSICLSAFNLLSAPVLPSGSTGMIRSTQRARNGANPHWGRPSKRASDVGAPLRLVQSVRSSHCFDGWIWGDPNAFMRARAPSWLERAWDVEWAWRRECTV